MQFEKKNGDQKVFFQISTKLIIIENIKFLTTGKQYNTILSGLNGHKVNPMDS